MPPTIAAPDLAGWVRSRATGADRFVVGIAGPPGSGKSTVAAGIADELGAPVVAMDGFHLPNAVLDERGLRDQKGAPETFDADGFVALVRRLREPSVVTRCPGFDRSRDETVADAVSVTADDRVVVVEGNYLLLDEAPWAALRELFDAVVYLDVADPVRVPRLVDRHVAHGRRHDDAVEFVHRSDEANTRRIVAGRDRAHLVVLPTAELPEWHVDVDGCVNFRDAGGWATDDGGMVRRGRLYRSDDPIRITPVGRAAVERLGLAMVVDLRQQTQFSRTPGFVEPARTSHVALVDQVVDHEQPPPLDTPRDIADLYAGMLTESRTQTAKVLDLVAEHVASGPVLVHCAFGKDRAGLMTALVHAAIGVRREDIVADYVRSDEPSRRRRAAMIASPLDDDPPVARLPETLFRAPAETIELLLDRAVDEHGSLAAWVASFPIAPTTVDRLRAALITTPL